MKKPRINQLTDDDINEFVYDLSEFLEETGMVSTNFFENDENWENLLGFVFGRLEKFSNGYINYN